ncbi:hypothetical protein Pint_34151 [Pistacia integerrima]|uniref:Uncharacterized protein n=1 Tax=Pistacia integerrima TaxID=434235 RepID=A0ACC0X5K3_9ROSI|nr:hypothetical protein Pint_34151 [Pistacia integerrima]
MEYDSLSRCLGGEMVDTRDSKSRAKERGGSSPLQGIILRMLDLGSIYWNWNKFGSGSRNLGDLLYLMNGESALKSSVLHPPPEYMLQQESHKSRLIQYKPLVKCPPVTQPIKQPRMGPLLWILSLQRRQHPAPEQASGNLLPAECETPQEGTWGIDDFHRFPG